MYLHKYQHRPLFINENYTRYKVFKYLTRTISTDLNQIQKYRCEVIKNIII